MKVGFIGLGIMGKPMAKNLLKAGHEVCVNDFHPESVAELVEAGATSAATNAEVAKDVEVVITMVPNSPNVRAALLEKDGVIDGASSDTVIIDMSSIDPVESKKISAELKEKKGIEMLDCTGIRWRTKGNRWNIIYHVSAVTKKYLINTVDLSKSYGRFRSICRTRSDPVTLQNLQTR